MHCNYYPNRESMSFAAAEQINLLVRDRPTAKLCLATGGTPERVYELVVEMNKSGSQSNSFKCAQMIKLDEWGGLKEEHPATCEFYLRQRLLKPLQIQPHQWLSFRSDAANRSAECDRIQQTLDELGAIDLCILGLGVNGHLGFNEPATTLKADVHVAQLTLQTQKHPMVETMEHKPTYGFTLGMADIMKSKKIMFLVSGEHKREQLKRFLQPEIDTQFPASFLWLHPDVTLYSDISL
jgi:galactosamine-6-phosphate isomerase